MGDLMNQKGKNTTANSWKNVNGMTRIEISVILTAVFILFLAAFLFIRHGLSLQGEFKTKIMVLSLLALGPALILDGIRIRVRKPESKKDWLVNVVIPPLVSLTAIPIYVWLEYTQIMYAYLVYAVGIFWLMTGIFRSPTLEVKEITRKEVFSDINRVLNEKIRLTDELFTELFETQNNLDLRSIRNMLSEYEDIIRKDRERLELVRDRLIIRLFEIAENCRRIVKRTGKSDEVRIILEQVCGVLEMEMDIVPMEIRVGEDKFDPKKHEIRGFDDRDDVPEDTIVEVLRQGYVNINSGDTEQTAFVRVTRHRRE